jgi:hypothetical protein
MPKRHRKKSTRRVDGYLVEHVKGFKRHNPKDGLEKVKGYVRDEPVKRHHKRRKGRRTVY